MAVLGRVGKGGRNAITPEGVEVWKPTTGATAAAGHACRRPWRLMMEVIAERLEG